MLEDIVRLIVDIVSNVGFPIACVCALFWYINKNDEAHKLESKNYAEAIKNNTIVMQEIKTLLEEMNNGGKA